MYWLILMLSVIGPWQGGIPAILVANINLLCLIDFSLATSATTSDENHIFNVVNVPMWCVCVICLIQKGISIGYWPSCYFQLLIGASVVLSMYFILVLYNLKIWHCDSLNWTCLLCCLSSVESICYRISSMVSMSE